ncbi:MAG: hypothetical protein JXB40_03225 [Candidatus Omnitrophica bacterium]|nr:hypothetical protein [Candidatus Omnitrophota bacterium]
MAGAVPERITAAFLFIIAACSLVYADDDNKPPCNGREVKFDMVTDTVKTTLNKAAALLVLDLDITMPPRKHGDREDFTTNAIGQRVPKFTAVKSAGSLHNDDPL